MSDPLRWRPNQRRCLACVTGFCCLLASRPVGATPLQQVLEASGWPAQRVAAIEAAQTLSPEDTTDLIRLAERLARFTDRLRIDAQARQPEPAAGFRPVLLSVEVLSAQVLPSGGCHCRASMEGHPLTVIAPGVPAAWLDDTLPQPAGLLGLEIGRGRVLAIDWRWLPVVADYPHVNFGESLLGGLGFDVGSLGDVKDGGPLRAIDAAPFYGLLSATRQIGPHQLARFAHGNLSTYAKQWRRSEPSEDAADRALAAEALRMASERRYSVAPLFNDAVHQRGELYVLEGLARRAVAIEAGAARGEGEPSVSSRHGVDRYYEIEVFTPDSRNLPIVFCVLELPEGFPLGDSIRVPVQVAGFSFKRWAYRTRKTTADGQDKPQLAPLLIGRAPILLEQPAFDSDSLGIAVGGAFALTLALVGWVVWRTNRHDAQFEKATRGRLSAPPARVDLSHLAELIDEPQGRAANEE